FYVFGLFAQGAYNVLNRTFYSLQDTKTPVMISIIVVALNVLFSMALVRVLQHGGLALSSSLAATINMILVYWFLRKRLPEIPERRMFFNLGKILLASLAMAVGVGFLNPLLAGYINLTSTWGQLLHLFSCILFGAAVYLAMVIALRVEEAWYVVSRLKQKFLPGS
ncbi:MAG: lipid II flippase MurJ, partial [Chitinophagales bacterium]